MCKRVTKGRTGPLVCTGFIVIRQALCQSPSLSGILLWVRNQLRKEIDHMAVNLMDLYFNEQGKLMLKQTFFFFFKCKETSCQSILCQLTSSQGSEKEKSHKKCILGCRGGGREILAEKASSQEPAYLAHINTLTRVPRIMNHLHYNSNGSLNDPSYQLFSPLPKSTSASLKPIPLFFVVTL